MKIAVCDDDLIFQRKIKEELDQYYQSLDVLVEIFSSGEDLLRAAAADPYGFFCVFLDIEMPGIDGMETARRLNAFRFLTKPLEHERLCRSLAALEAKGREQARISVTKDGRDLFLPVEDLLYIKSENIYLSLVTPDHTYLIRKKLKDLLPQLPPAMFCQIHRSYVVNLHKVFSYSGKDLVMEDQTVLPVSRNRRETLKEALLRSMAGKAAWEIQEDRL